jgi:hypothetical protein
MICNNGFETDLSVEWNNRSGIWDNSAAHGGNYSVRRDPDSSNTFNVVNSKTAIPVTSGKVYTLRGWVKNEATQGTVAMGVRLINAAGGTAGYLWQYAEPGTDWTQVELNFVIPADVRSVAVNLRMYEDVDGSAWFDDLYLAESKITVPLFAPGYPKLGVRTATTADVKVQSDRDGTVYYVVLDAGTAEPSAMQVKMGHNAAGEPLSAQKSGSVPILANTEGMLTLQQLTASASYEVYLVAEDAGGSLQLSAAR